MPKVDIFREAFFIIDENQLLTRVVSNVSGEFIFESTVVFIERTDLMCIGGLLNIEGVLVSQANNFRVSLLEKTYVSSSVTGALDIYATELPPAVMDIKDKVKVYLRIDGVLNDITSRVISLDISYSLDKYVGEMTAVFKDEFYYSEFVPMKYFGEPVFVVYADNVNIGEFLFESRTGSAEFGKSQVSVWGRTRPALLSPPYCGLLARSWNEDTTARTIVEDVLASFPGVTVLWNIMDYPILAGKVVADRTAPIEIIAMLAEPVGGRLTTNFNGDIVVDYRWKPVSL